MDKTDTDKQSLTIISDNQTTEMTKTVGTLIKMGCASSGGVNQLGGHYVNGRPLNQR